MDNGDFETGDNMDFEKKGVDEKEIHRQFLKFFNS